MGKVLWAILAFILLFAFTSPITTGIHDLRTEELTQVFTNVATGAGVSTANVTLTTDPFLDRTSEVESISSNITETTTPTAAAYTTATNFLNVAGLAAASTRTLTVVYDAQLDDDYVAIIGPFLTFIIFGGILFAIVYGMWKGKRR